MIELPLNHFHHLNRLIRLRRGTLPEAIEFLKANVEPNPENWLDAHWGQNAETRKLTDIDISEERLLDLIQGLPRNIRPVTDGPYLKEFDFISHKEGLLGITAEGVSILDFEMQTERDRSVYELVKDLLPEMSVPQYRVYNTFTAQFLRLVREPNLFTMPRINAPAVDAGCYVGYKAFALARFVNRQDVLAIEVASDNYDVLEINARNNPAYPIKPIRCALSDRREAMVLNTRNPRTMAHSLTRFDKLKEHNTDLLVGVGKDGGGEVLETILLDDLTGDYEEISALHISVNGHEPEVVKGGLESARKSDVMRISCPYKRGDVPVFNIVSDTLRANGIPVFGKSGAAVIAGRSQGEYHAVAQ
jgi:FkbM family methyltransferase